MSTFDSYPLNSLYDNGDPTMQDLYPDLDERFAKVDLVARKLAEEDEQELGWESVTLPSLKVAFGGLKKLFGRRSTAEELPPPIID